MNKLAESVIIKNYSQSQPIAQDIRIGVIEWLFLLHKKLGGEKITFFKTIQIFDLYLSKESEILKKTEIELFSAVCLFICFKLDEVEYFDLAFLQHKILRNKFSKQKIIESEIKILRTLSFRVNASTIQSFTDDFLINLDDPYGIYNGYNYFVNIIMLIIEDVRFLYSNERLSKISFIVTIRLLLIHKYLSQEHFDKMYKMFDVHDLEFAEIIYQMDNEQISENKLRIVEFYKSCDLF
jgi:hypothetical protein